MKYKLNKEKQEELTFDDLNFGELFVWENGNKDSVAMKAKVRQMGTLRCAVGYVYLDDSDVWIIGDKYSKTFSASDSVIRVSSNEVIFNTVSK